MLSWARTGPGPTRAMQASVSKAIVMAVKKLSFIVGSALAPNAKRAWQIRASRPRSTSHFLIPRGTSPDGPVQADRRACRRACAAALACCGDGCYRMRRRFANVEGSQAGDDRDGVDVV